MALGTYNRTPANRTGGVMIYEAKYKMMASATLAVDLGVQYACAYHYTSEMQADADLWWGYDEHYLMQTEIAAQAAATAWVQMAYALIAETEFFANPALDCLYRMAGNLMAAAAAYTAVTQGWDAFYATLTMEVSGVQTRETIMTLDGLVIPPGGTVIIDNDNFSITLNGQNIIDKYSGDWFYFTRQLQGVDVESGTSGTLRVSILYREKYL